MAKDFDMTGLKIKPNLLVLQANFLTAKPHC